MRQPVKSSNVYQSFFLNKQGRHTYSEQKAPPSRALPNIVQIFAVFLPSRTTVPGFNDKMEIRLCFEYYKCNVFNAFTLCLIK